MSQEDKPRPSGRQRRGDERRRLIIDAAAREFARKGYEGGSVRSVARTLGIDLPLIQHHFGDKRSLWDAVLDDVLGGSRRALQQTGLLHAERPAAVQLACAVEALILYAAFRRAFVALMTHAGAAATDETDDFVRELGEQQSWLIALIGRAQADGAVVAGAPVLLFYHLVGAALRLFATAPRSEMLLASSLTEPALLHAHIRTCLRLFMPDDSVWQAALLDGEGIARMAHASDAWGEGSSAAGADRGAAVAAAEAAVAADATKAAVTADAE